MSWLSLSQIAQMLDARLLGDDMAVQGVSTDTRQPVKGTLFIALKGSNFDAHDVLDQELNEPPAALLVSRPLDLDVPQILVEDTRLALGHLSRAWRKECAATVIAVTGSNGKTTVKEMLAAILGQAGKTLATAGNLNNDIGVPLTLLRLRSDHKYAIIEMGANHVGEIAYLTNLASPDIALLNNASAAHLEGFGTLENVIKAKGEIFAGLKAGGAAILNADSPALYDWLPLVDDFDRVTFGFSQEADCRVTGTTPLKITRGAESVNVALALPGRHNQLNAAAAAASALAVGLPLPLIAQGLERMKAVAGRLCVLTHASGAVIIDDSYNANPASMQAGINTLKANSGTRILVIGDMAELGATARASHRDVGLAASVAGLEGLCALGVDSQAAVEAFGTNARHFDSAEALCDHLVPCLREGVTMLVKGSRSARMERVVDGLMAREANRNQECRYAA